MARLKFWLASPMTQGGLALRASERSLLALQCCNLLSRRAHSNRLIAVPQRRVCISARQTRRAVICTPAPALAA